MKINNSKAMGLNYNVPKGEPLYKKFEDEYNKKVLLPEISKRE
jgi:hypothetical protein